MTVKVAFMYVMMAYGGHEHTAPLIPHLSARWWWVVSLTPRPL